MLLARFTQSLSVSSSALLFPNWTDWTDAWRPSSVFRYCFRFEDTFFLLWAKPARTICQNCPSFSLFSVKIFLEMFFMLIAAESTLGAGEKYLAGTFITVFGVPYAFTEIERMLSFPSLAIILLATSFCTKSIIRSGCPPAGGLFPKNFFSIAPVMLYGILAITL